jgi:hypothetical protein
LSWAGIFLPFLSARRRIPAHALRLKKYRCGTLPIGSKTSDKKHASPSLRYSPKLAVENRPCERIPEPIKGGEEASEILPARHDPRHVFPEQPFWAHLSNQADIRHRKSRSRVAESFFPSPDAESLARTASNNDVDFITVRPPIYLGYVPKVFYVGVMVLQDGAGEGVYLRECYWLEL